MKPTKWIAGSLLMMVAIVGVRSRTAHAVTATSLNERFDTGIRNLSITWDSRDTRSEADRRADDTQAPRRPNQCQRVPPD